MKVGEIMTRGVEVANPDDTLQQAAGRMAELDTGVLPVGENDRLVGMLTDRDIAVRAVAQGKGLDTRVREAMTPEVCGTSPRTRTSRTPSGAWARTRCAACR